MKIAIFGGSFNPPHLGHEKIIQELNKRFDLSFIVPVDNYQKSLGLIPIQSRIKLLKELTKSLKKIQIMDDFLNDPEMTYSYRVIQKVREKYPKSKIFLALGTDYSSIESWKKSEYIIQEATLLYISRGTDWGEDWGVPSFSSSEIVRTGQKQGLSKQVRDFLKKKN